MMWSKMLLLSLDHVFKQMLSLVQLALLLQHSCKLDLRFLRPRMVRCKILALCLDDMLKQMLCLVELALALQHRRNVQRCFAVQWRPMVFRTPWKLHKSWIVFSCEYIILWKSIVQERQCLLIHKRHLWLCFFF